MIQKVLLLLVFGFFSMAAGAQELSLGPEDFRIEQRADGGFHLYIRKKPDIGSVLITESTRDPALRSDNYAYRAAEWNPVNGDEIRLLNGLPIPRESNIYSLIDSTPEDYPGLGAAFHIFIPWILNYGYETSRNGEIYVTDGTYLNIRAFRLPFADYRSSFQDNPFVLRVTQKPQEGPPEGNYMKETEDAFREIASRGYLERAEGPGDLVERIRDILEKEKGKAVDIVLCLDTTASMKDDIDAVRRMLIPMLREIIAGFSSFRIGLVMYKDYNEEYLTNTLAFTDDFAVFQRNLNSIQVRGGRDIPEAVYEALYDGAVQFPWAAESRVMILIGDAPPHPRQRGKISKEMVDTAVEENSIKVSAIILPQ
jgi:Mg-chelatase subunit ChlD